MATRMTKEAWTDLRLRYSNDLSQEGIVVRFLMGMNRALLRYTKHFSKCKAIGRMGKCTCGLDALRRELVGE